MKTVILDTSFILHAFQYRIDIISGLKKLLDFNFTVAVIDETIQELKGKKLGSLAASYITTNNITIINTPKDKNVDNLILDNLNPDTIVATQDMKLKEKLKKRKSGLITIRQKRYLAVV